MFTFSSIYIPHTCENYYIFFLLLMKTIYLFFLKDNRNLTCVESIFDFSFTYVYLKMYILFSQKNVYTIFKKKNVYTRYTLSFCKISSITTTFRRHLNNKFYYCFYFANFVNFHIITGKLIHQILSKKKQENWLWCLQKVGLLWVHPAKINKNKMKPWR